MLIMSFGCLRFLRESCLLYAFLLGYLPSIFLRFFYGNLLTFICRTPSYTFLPSFLVSFFMVSAGAADYFVGLR